MKYQYPTKTLKERFKKLPKELQEAILTVDSNEDLKDITEKYNLHIDKSAELMDEVGLTMLGIHNPNNFKENIKDRIGIEDNLAREITADIDEVVFAPIKESLKKITEDKNAEDEEEETLEREELLREIENPPEAKPILKKPTPKEVGEKEESGKKIGDKKQLEKKGHSIPKLEWEKERETTEEKRDIPKLEWREDKNKKGKECKEGRVKEETEEKKDIFEEKIRKTTKAQSRKEEVEKATTEDNQKNNGKEIVEQKQKDDSTQTKTRKEDNVGQKHKTYKDKDPYREPIEE